jgi:DNA-binding transcriptional ArsR family regulator
MINDDIADELDTRSYKDTSIDLMIPNQKYKKMEFKSNKEIENELNKEMVLKALRSRGQIGATSSEIAEITDLSQVTARKHLEELCKIREAYKLKRGKQITIYYINGKPRHEYGIKKVEDGDTTFEMCLAEGPNNKILLHLIEKKLTLLEGESIEGGVIIPIDLIPEINKKMKDFYDKIDEGR